MGGWGGVGRVGGAQLFGCSAVCRALFTRVTSVEHAGLPLLTTSLPAASPAPPPAPRRTRGWCSSARASASRCSWPPLSRLPPSPSRVEKPSGRAWMKSSACAMRAASITCGGKQGRRPAWRGMLCAQAQRSTHNLCSAGPPGLAGAGQCTRTGDQSAAASCGLAYVSHLVGRGAAGQDQVVVHRGAAGGGGVMMTEWVGSGKQQVASKEGRDCRFIPVPWMAGKWQHCPAKAGPAPAAHAAACLNTTGSWPTSASWRRRQRRLRVRMLMPSISTDPSSGS